MPITAADIRISSLRDLLLQEKQGLSLILSLIPNSNVWLFPTYCRAMQPI